ncbi:tRNA (adenosine(37)-N6)-threonylcarbamoyltransferase complex transferase subunit TsaD [Acholeplasma equirhinis]|uniref:tRNA (adenosine(37)-N6)-threonylcarbamoyltransferase complex transferase subunit TsaD n=1 Tax=Acholeplasma equirhinis TaxID=555393 RepID=UPI00197A841C|nr:tRNA (adenosine(37)-N6)-threonylcarbamoyltransferase complex transferase subunit TsaD [Acholeplasma equirhinis]MBN3490987.1 tRNA (adenosine(37)-N6)-threonylcarbamoyltransferase complex transferase subunit TsaD [Acholeplasma equirhinis]
MIILSVETSCDETSVAITKDGKEVLSNAVLSQIKIHERYGGVVPEIASRAHIESILYMFDEAISTANIKVSDIDLVAVTQGPGLIGSLLVGINAATTFAYMHKLPILGVNHLIGHIYAPLVENDFNFPALALLVSGGHTELLLIKDHFEIELLGTTLDDAVGEAYDKVARILGLPYPGGPVVDRLAATGKAIYPLPKPFLKDDPYNFSFSGLKSAVLNLVHNMKQRGESFNVEDVCASFQEVVTEVLVEKTRHAADSLGVNQVVLAGGVAANKGLRAKMASRITNQQILVPAFKYCTDQAAMIGIAAYYQVQKYGMPTSYFIKGDSSFSIDEVKQY